MTKISDRPNVRSRTDGFELTAPAGAQESKAPQPSVVNVPGPLQPRRIASGASAPRAALPASTSRHGATPAPAAGTIFSRYIKILPLPTLPELPKRSIFVRLADKKRKRYTLFEPLWKAYNKATHKDLKMFEFVEVLFQSTGKPGTHAFKTGHARITCFRMPLPGSLEPVHILCRTTAEGVLADMYPLSSVADDVLQDALKVMQRAAAVSAGMKVALVEGPTKICSRSNAADEFQEVFDAYSNRSDIENVSRLTFHKLLCKWAAVPGASAGAAEDGIERFNIQVPGFPARVAALGVRNAKGEVVRVHQAPLDRNEEGWICDKLRMFVKYSAKRAVDKKSGTGNKRALGSLWDAIEPEVKEDYKAWRTQQSAGTSVNRISHSRRVYVEHLLQLCNDTPGEVVDRTARITRHNIMPDDGTQSAMTVLALKDEHGATVALRKVGVGKTEALLCQALIKHAQQSQASNKIWAGLQARTTADAIPAAPQADADEAVPALATKVTQANEMKQALAMMVANRAENRWFLHGVEAATQVSESAFRNWFRRDGSLRKTPSMFVVLSEYAKVADEIKDLFSRLGQHDVAAKLPKQMNAQLLVELLEAKLEGKRRNVDLTREALADALKVPGMAMRYWVDAAGRLMIADKRMSHLPGYAEHKDQIDALLCEMGDEQAGKLPPAPSAGEQVLQGIKQSFYLLKSTVLAMAQDRTLPLQEAVAMTGAPQAMVQALVADDGSVRGWAGVLGQLSTIGTRVLGEEAAMKDDATFGKQLSSLDGATLRKLEDLLQQLQAVAPASRMVTKRLRAGWTGTLFVVPGAGMADATGAAKGLKEIYRPPVAKAFIRKPRSFERERGRQALRWLSTALKRKFPDAIEIQSYYDHAKGVIWVSSNLAGVNVKLQAFLNQERGGLQDFLDKTSGSHETRSGRHAWKLRRMLDRSVQHPDPLARGVLESIAKGAFRVPDEEVYENGRSINLHAERRIGWALQAEPGDMAFNLNLLAGTMRPCGICADELGFPDVVHRGPFWLSRASQAFADMPDVVERNRVDQVGSSVTQDRNGNLTVKHDTDSDSDADADANAGAGTSRKTDKATLGRQRSEVRAVEGPAIMPESSREAIDNRQGLSYALQDSRALLASLNVPVADIPAALPLREQVQRVLQALLQEGKQRFLTTVRAGAGTPESNPTPQYQVELKEIARCCAALRRNPEALLREASPTLTLPAGVPQDGMWSEQEVHRVFTRGVAKGADNICWFDTVAQLWLGVDRTQPNGRMDGVEQAARKLRRAADRLGISKPLQMFDHDNDAVHVIAHALGLQVHLFQATGNAVSLHPLNSAGSPTDDRHVYLYLSGMHFEPLWLRPGSMAGTKRKAPG